jgi:hypothetical protein
MTPVPCRSTEHVTQRHVFSAPPRRLYLETTCKSVLNRVSGMPFRWSLNPYRGCVHGCHCGYARATHAYLGMNADDDFTSRIIVKTNMPEVRAVHGDVGPARLGRAPSSSLNRWER